MANEFIYKQIFTDIKTSEPNEKGYRQFIRVTVYASDFYSAPILYKTSSGWNWDEDAPTAWVTDEHRTEANAIRHAIQIIDSYVFPGVKAEAQL